MKTETASPPARVNLGAKANARPKEGPAKRGTTTPQIGLTKPGLHTTHSGTLRRSLHRTPAVRGLPARITSITRLQASPRTARASVMDLIPPDAIAKRSRLVQPTRPLFPTT